MDHPVFADDWLWRLFCWCIMRASYKEGKDKRGSFTTGRNDAADRLGVSPSKVYRGLQKLRDLGCISLEVNSSWTTITVCNYDIYQNAACEDEQQKNNPADSKRTGQRTASEQQVNNLADTNRKNSNKLKEGERSNGDSEVDEKELEALGDFTGYSQAFGMAWSAYPPRRRSKKVTAMQAWRDAVDSLADRFGGKRQAEDWLQRRILTFSKSPTGKSKYCPAISKWLTDGRYDDDPEAWATGDDQAPSIPPPVTTPPPVPARIKRADFISDPYAEANRATA